MHAPTAQEFADLERTVAELGADNCHLTRENARLHALIAALTGEPPVQVQEPPECSC